MHGCRRPAKKLRGKKIGSVRPLGTNQTRVLFMSVTFTGLEIENKCIHKTTHQYEVAFIHENVLFADNCFDFKSCYCVSTIMHTEHVFTVCRGYSKTFEQQRRMLLKVLDCHWK